MKPWSAGRAIKARRKALRLSLEELGDRLGVTKSFMSYVESDERCLTNDQATSLSLILGLPVDLLLLGSGRLPEDVKRALNVNAVEVTASIRQRYEQRVLTYPHAPAVSLESLKKRKAPTAAPRTIPERIRVSKGTTEYRAHSYHTKVPPEAIRPFIQALTEPGDWVLDPFCGSGMTGVAALMEGRNAVLSDLSTAAVHISRNYTSYCDPSEFDKALAGVESLVEPTMRWLYSPADEPKHTVEYTTWSDVFSCSACNGDIVYWDVVHTPGATDARGVTCPSCRLYQRKADLRWKDERPILTHYSTGSTRISTHALTKGEIDLIEESNTAPVPYWVPEVQFGSDREMWRASHTSMGISDVASFFTRRNLHALAALRHAIVSTSSGRILEALMFAFTASVNRASKRYQWNAKRPTNVMSGTLYVSSLRYEWNVWSLFRRKAADVKRYFEKFPKTSGTVAVAQRSATDLSCIPDASISLVFMDPPFGANIFYADSSLLWESWLGRLTDSTEEMVVNKSRGRVGGGKTLDDYGQLMTRAFSEVARVVRPDGYAVLAFSNSDDQVWLEVQKAMTTARLETVSVHILDKGQPSIKGVKGISGKESVTTLDLLVTMRKSNKSLGSPADNVAPANQIEEITRTALARGVRRIDDIYSSVIQVLLSENLSLQGITMPSIADVCRRVGAIEEEGGWALPSLPLPVSRDFVAGYIASPETLPVGSNSVAPESAPQNSLVAGSRNTALYTAHSYHTKVPPGAILPFIEHFSSPGDVVLDPFCGSGMTGVAAAMAGRKAILNDLSPAAVHLAWNHTHKCDPSALDEAFCEIENAVGARLSALYSTTDSKGNPATLHWMMWSTKHRCPECKKAFTLWDAVDHEEGRMGSALECPSCGARLLRRTLETIESIPAWLSYEDQNGKRGERKARKQDIDEARAVTRDQISHWYPSVGIGADREMYIRCALRNKNVEEVADFYTARNLLALSIIWEAILAVADERKRRAMAFAFTNTAWHGTKMRRYNARGGQRPLTGTLYIPQLSSECNVLEVMRNKIPQLKKYYSAFVPTCDVEPFVINGSAADLKGIADTSVDYIFTDPPFGSNLFYADCNLIWESWLGRVTDVTDEAVVNKSLSSRSGGKSLDDYERLMAGSMREMARVLKPGGWATVVFHNTDPRVWSCIQRAAIKAGFEFHDAASLDRKEQSHKGYKGRAGTEDVAHFDVVMNLRKASDDSSAAIHPRTPLDVQQVVNELCSDPSFVKRGIQGIHAEVMRRLASTGDSTFVSFAEVRRMAEAAAPAAKSSRGRRSAFK